MIRTQRNGRWGKWHKAMTWASNDAFWITSCGIAVFKNSSSVAETGEPMCESCRRSLQSDSAKPQGVVRFAAMHVEVEGDDATVKSTMHDLERLLGGLVGK